MVPNVLSIAGSDPSGGAGIQADLKTFAAMGCFGMAAITALTAQNTRGVSAIHLPPASFVAEQITQIFADIEVAAVKIGMLGTPDIVEAVAGVLAAWPGLPIVLDPVLVATSGATLGDDTVVAALWRHLVPISTVITPNLAEAARLAGTHAELDGTDPAALARALRHRVATGWLVKGGHLQDGLLQDGHAEGGHPQSDSAEDILLTDTFVRLSSPRIATRNTHGTGCTLSSAIAAGLAKGLDLVAAVRQGKAFIDAALAGADRLSVGHGPGPVDHLAWQRRP